LESLSISVWLSWISHTLSVNIPGLMVTIVAVPEDNMSVVNVSSSVNIEALLSVVSDVSISSTIEGNSLVDLTSPWSDSSRMTDLVSSTHSVGNNVGSSLGRSDGSSSSVEEEPLLDVSWEGSSNSELILVGANMLSVEECSVG